MKKLLTNWLICLFVILPTTMVKADDSYTDWDDHDVVGLYIEISKSDAQKYGFDEMFGEGSNARFFEKARIDSGLYEIEVYDKVDSRFWGIRGTKIFIKFRYNPFLYNYDEGVLDWDGYSGTFYEKP